MSALRVDLADVKLAQASAESLQDGGGFAHGGIDLASVADIETEGRVRKTFEDSLQRRPEQSTKNPKLLWHPCGAWVALPKFYGTSGTRTLPKVFCSAVCDARVGLLPLPGKPSKAGADCPAARYTFRQVPQFREDG